MEGGEREEGRGAYGGTLERLGTEGKQVLTGVDGSELRVLRVWVEVLPM